MRAWIGGHGIQLPQTMSSIRMQLAKRNKMKKTSNKQCAHAGPVLPLAEDTTMAASTKAGGQTEHANANDAAREPDGDSDDITEPMGKEYNKQRGMGYLDLAWCASITWEQICGLSGTTCVQVP